jgi:hypothetical protein
MPRILVGNSNEHDDAQNVYALRVGCLVSRALRSTK